MKKSRINSHKKIFSVYPDLSTSVITFIRIDKVKIFLHFTIPKYFIITYLK